MVQVYRVVPATSGAAIVRVYMSCSRPVPFVLLEKRLQPAGGVLPAFAR